MSERKDKVKSPDTPSTPVPVSMGTPVKEKEVETKHKVKKNRKPRNIVPANKLKPIDFDKQFKETKVTHRLPRVAHIIDASIHHELRSRPLRVIQDYKDMKRKLVEMLEESNHLFAATAIHRAYKYYMERLKAASKYVDFQKYREDDEAKKKRPMILPDNFDHKAVASSVKSSDDHEEIKELSGDFINLCKAMDKSDEENLERKRKSGSGRTAEKHEVKNAVTLGYFRYLSHYSTHKHSEKLLAEWNKLSEDEQKSLRKNGKRAPKKYPHPGAYVADPLAEIQNPYDQAEFIIKSYSVIVGKNAIAAVTSILDTIGTDLIVQSVRTCLAEEKRKTISVDHLFKNVARESKFYRLVSNTDCWRDLYKRYMADQSIDDIDNLLQVAFKLPETKDFLDAPLGRMKSIEELENEDQDDIPDDTSEAVDEDDEEESEAGDDQESVHEIDDDADIIVPKTIAKVKKDKVKKDKKHGIRDLFSTVQLLVKQVQGVLIDQCYSGNIMSNKISVSNLKSRAITISHLKVSREFKRAIASVLFEYCYRLIKGLLNVMQENNKHTIQTKMVYTALQILAEGAAVNSEAIYNSVLSKTRSLAKYRDGEDFSETASVSNVKFSTPKVKKEKENGRHEDGTSKRKLYTPVKMEDVDDMLHSD
jgi:hypothetical protein